MPPRGHVSALQQQLAADAEERPLLSRCGLCGFVAEGSVKVCREAMQEHRRGSHPELPVESPKPHTRPGFGKNRKKPKVDVVDEERIARVIARARAEEEGGPSGE